MKNRTTLRLRTLVDAVLTPILTPTPRSRAQLGAVDLGETVALELRRIGAEVKSGQAALAARLTEVEQKGARRGEPSSAGRAGPVNVGDRIASAVLASTQLEELRAGTLKTARIPIGSFHGEGPRAAVTLTNDGAAPFPARDPEIFGPLPRRTAIADLLPRRTTTASSIQYLTATRTGLAAQQVVEGDVKPQIDLGVVLVTAPVVTVAAWTAASRQALDDGGQLRDFVSSTLLDALHIAEDASLLSGTGAPGHMLGLLTAATAFGGTGTTPSDKLRNAITAVALAGGYADGIVVSPSGLEALELEKSTTGEYILQLVVDVNGASRIWRCPIVTSLAMATNDFLCGDFGRATRLWDREQATIAVSLEHADFWTRNLAAILAEERLALTIPRPALLVKGVFA